MATDPNDRLTWAKENILGRQAQVVRGGRKAPLGLTGEVIAVEIRRGCLYVTISGTTTKAKNCDLA